jgi:hypothetical protein
VEVDRQRIHLRQRSASTSKAEASKLSLYIRGNAAMTNWTSDELDKIGKADELQIVTFRRDGTPRKPVTIWVVRHGDDLYVRSGYGDRAAWYHGTQRHRDGHIKAGGVDKDVAFADADPALNDQIDAAYRTKYRRHGAQWVDPMVAAEARSTTIKLVPR